MHHVVEQARQQREWEKFIALEKEQNEVNDDGIKENENTVKDVNDFTNETTTSTSLWIYLYRCAKLGSRSLWKKKKNSILEEQIRYLCDKVIQHRLTKTQCENDKLDRTSNVPIGLDIVTCFCNMTDVIIYLNPTLYTDIALKLNITFQEERLVCKAYSDFAEILFSKGTTWPLIVSFLAFTSCLAVECAKQGRSILVRSLSDWATIFLIMHMKDWIVKNGRWNGALKYFQPKKQSSAVISSKILNVVVSKYKSNGNLLFRGLMVTVVCLVAYVLWDIGCSLQRFIFRMM